MSAITIDRPTIRPHVRAVADGRPPSQTWSHAAPHRSDQPALALEPDPVREPGPPRTARHQVHVVGLPWSSGRAPTLPDPRGWSASLALAVAETLQGRRPVGQLSRWVDEQVLASLTCNLRQRRRPPTLGGPGLPAATRPPVLRSVHLQFPTPGVVEIAAHVYVDGRSTAFALRLDAWYDRWLCTALELGPRDRTI